MVVAVIRHAKVDTEWEFWQTSEEYDKGNERYDAAPVLPVSVNLPDIEFQRIYVSRLPRTAATASQVFGDRKWHATALLNEVPDKSSFDLNLRLPGYVWPGLSRIQWFFGMGRQPESRKQTRRRAERFVRHLIRRNEDCAVFTHGFFMITLLRVMKEYGFRPNHTRLFYKNGECVLCVYEPSKSTTAKKGNGR